MPTISVFYGIIISINFGDHAPPHLHARHGEHEALFDIRTGAVLDGWLPRREARRVVEWNALNREALMTNWNLAVNRQSTFRIPGLDA